MNNNRYSRHLALPDFTRESQSKLSQARILVAGCGGLGHPVLQYLVAAGIGAIGIADDDTVQMSNLQRQVLFLETDIGHAKTTVASGRLKQMNSETVINEHVIRINKDNIESLLTQYHLVIDCTDNFETRYILDHACEMQSIPLVYGSLFRYEGHVSLLHGKQGIGYRDIFAEPPSPGSVPDCASGGVLGALAGVIGSIQACEAIKYLTGIGDCLDGSLLIMDMKSMQTDKIKLHRRSDRHQAQMTHSPEQNFATSENSVTGNDFEITSSELSDLMHSDIPFQLIDVREGYEYAEENIGGLHIPLNEIETRLSEITPDKKIIVHCMMGIRSAHAVAILRGYAGYEDSFSLRGGLTAWNEQTRTGSFV